MGIGLFLAITTIRRSGGNIRFSRLKPQGTNALIDLPLMTHE